MEIEVITTTKKVTKSVIKQLEWAKLHDITHFINMKTDGFYVRDLGPKYSKRVLLFQGINSWVVCMERDWEVCSYNHSKLKAYVSRNSSTIKEFNNQMECEVYLNAYNELRKRCLKNHLIL